MRAVELTTYSRKKADAHCCARERRAFHPTLVVCVSLRVRDRVRVIYITKRACQLFSRKSGKVPSVRVAQTRSAIGGYTIRPS